MADTITLGFGEYLIYEGEHSNEMYYVTKGTLAIMKKKGSVEQQIGTVYSGEVVGEMSFMDEKPRCASVRALSECELTVIHRIKFSKAMDDVPIWYRGLVNTLVQRLREANVRIKV